MGTLNTFLVRASDANGETVILDWSLDGVPSGSGGVEYNYSPGPADEGVHILAVRANDGHGLSSSGVHSWLIKVSQPVSLVDLRVSQTQQHSAAQIGQDIVYQIVLTNSGPDAATEVMLTNFPPAGAQYVSLTPSQGSVSQVGDAVVASLATVNSGTSVVLTLVVSGTTAGLFSNTVVAVSTQTDVNPADNVSKVGTRISDPAALVADLSVSQVGTPRAIRVGGTLTYAITVQNRGPNDATGVILTESMPPGLTFLGSIPPATTAGDNVFTWSLGTIANSSLGNKTSAERWNR